MIYFTADTHFNHDKIIEFCNRPFKDVTEMNKKLIIYWNSRVNKGDLVYHLGDFGWRNYEPILNQLNGQIILIRGSHDYNDEVKHKKIVNVHRLLNKRIDKQPITMCHYCMRTWHLSHYNSWHLFGHSHGRLKPIGKSYDVGVDCNNFFPVSLEEIKEIMKNKPNNFNYVNKELKI